MELAMNARERLLKVQERLAADGVSDVKFFFNTFALGTPSAAAESAAIVLEAYLDGKCEIAQKYVKRAH